MKISKLNLRQLFAKGKKPVQESFYNWFDSYWHKDEGISVGAITGLQGQLDNKLDSSAQDTLITAFNKALNQASFGLKGKATPTTVPTVYDPIIHPDGLYEKYDVEVDGTFVNFLKSDGQPVIITDSDLDGYVQIAVINGVAEKSIKSIPLINLEDRVIVGDITKAVSGKAVADYIPKSGTTNLFDWTDITPNFYFDSDGNFIPQPLYFISHKIPVTAGKTYSKGSNNVGFWSASDVLISYHNFNSPSALVAPENGYMLVTSTIENSRNIVIVKGASLPAEYISGEKKISTDVLPDSAVFTLNASINNGDNIFDRESVTTNGSTFKSGRIKLTGTAYYIKNKGILTVYDATGYAVTQYPSNSNYNNKPFFLPGQIAYGFLEGDVSDLDTTLFNQGKILLPWEKPEMRSTRNLIKGLGDESVIVVSKSNGDFADIASAIQYSFTKSSITNPITILIFPGDYYEHLNVPSLYITLKGINRETCRIIDESGDYINAPINMGGAVTVENLTIIANRDQQVGTPQNPSYGIHHDSEGEGPSLIRNCTVISENSNALGIGLQHNQQLTVDNCLLISTQDQRGAILFHNAVHANNTNQKFVVKNTQMYCDNDDVVALLDSNHLPGGAADNFDTEITFQNCIGYRTDGVLPSIEGTPSEIDGVKAFGYMRLKGDSFGNNIAEMNF